MKGTTCMCSVQGVLQRRSEEDARAAEREAHLAAAQEQRATTADEREERDEQPTEHEADARGTRRNRDSAAADETEQERAARRQRVDGNNAETAAGAPPPVIAAEPLMEARKRGLPQSYDETKRRQRRKTHPWRYLERGNGRGAKRHAIVVGPAVMERIVDGRYEWRDANLKRPRH